MRRLNENTVLKKAYFLLPWHIEQHLFNNNYYYCYCQCISSILRSTFFYIPTYPKLRLITDAHTVQQKLLFVFSPISILNIKAIHIYKRRSLNYRNPSKFIFCAFGDNYHYNMNLCNRTTSFYQSAKIKLKNTLLCLTMRNNSFLKTFT